MSRVGHKCRESGEITSEILKKPEFAGIFRGKKNSPYEITIWETKWRVWDIQKNGGLDRQRSLEQRPD